MKPFIGVYLNVVFRKAFSDSQEELLLFNQNMGLVLEKTSMGEYNRIELDVETSDIQGPGYFIRFRADITIQLNSVKLVGNSTQFRSCHFSRKCFRKVESLHFWHCKPVLPD